MCVNTCIKRSCQHIKDPVVCVIVWWIKETHSYSIHITDVNICIYSTKKVGHLKSNRRQRSANHKVWNFFQLVKPKLKYLTKHNPPPNHRPPLTLPLSHSLTLLLQPFSASSINQS